jgi:metal-responsive CopG/Arc/MetJ family transcriptional regulator
MSHVEPIRVSVRFAPAFLALLDDHRRQLEDIPDRAETIRRLVQQALANSNRKREKVPRRTATR